MKPFLDELVASLKAVPGREKLDDMQALDAIYQLIGAVSYFDISKGTLEQMYGKKAFANMKAVFPGQLKCLIDQVVS